jgi:uncharacterized protein (TIGR00266 family)
MSDVYGLHRGVMEVGRLFNKKTKCAYILDNCTSLLSNLVIEYFNYCGGHELNNSLFWQWSFFFAKETRTMKNSDVIDYRIEGDDMQAVIITLDPTEVVVAEAGMFLYMTDGVSMQTSMSTDKNKGFFGNLMKAAGRMLTGESFFITNFENTGAQRADVAFAAPYPGKIVPLDLATYPSGFIAQKDSFLCAARGTDISIHFNQKIGAGLFGGEGFILQKIQGDGLAFIHSGGTVIERTLEPGQTLRVDTGCVVGFEPSVDFDIQFVGGFKNALFGGEGLWFATLRGPGRVFLQTLPFARLANRIGSVVAGGRSVEQTNGGLLGGLMGDND